MTTEETRRAKSAAKSLKHYYRNKQKCDDKRFQRRYGISLADKQELIEKQAGLCAICVTEGATELDHCHATGVIRGVLCKGCNTALGGFKDNPAFLAKAIEYLHDAEANRDT